MQHCHALDNVASVKAYGYQISLRYVVIDSTSEYRHSRIYPDIAYECQKVILPGR